MSSRTSSTCSGKSLTWHTNLTVEVSPHSPIFQPRSDPSVRGPEGCDSPRSPGILRKERSWPNGGESDTQRVDWEKEQEVLQGPVAVKIREARLGRMLDRQVRETETTRPLVMEVGITLTNAREANDAGGGLDLVGTLQTPGDDLCYRKPGLM